MRTLKESLLSDIEKTIGNLIDKQSVAFISSIDTDGFPNMKAMLPPRKRDGIKTFYFTTNTLSSEYFTFIMNHLMLILLAKSVNQVFYIFLI